MTGLVGLSLYVIFSLWAVYLVSQSSVNEYKVHSFEGARRSRHAVIPTVFAVLCIVTFICLAMGV